ncbi:hypothetical protein HOO54_17280 [Bacillus sp. WMMC1349]|uniref:hypothetical protein n=1 Tax=Bacillus sp. WMMC1349 TaxID=2736254 RepID=UPI0015535EEB|nr:hypothetical protein [Bacillus sp. WMMC1349]NPC93919.1 hypothetical protein [Bacillus sp. WMMC1349]
MAGETVIMENKISQMNKQLFRNNLLKTIEKVTLKQNIRLCEEIRFTLCVNDEQGKSHNSNDDFMRLGILSEKNIDNRVLRLDEVIDMLVHPRLLFPLWVNVSISEVREDCLIFKLESSSRFRRPTELQNKGTSHPPFKAIL